MTKLGHLHNSTVNNDLQRFSRPIYIFISSLHLSLSLTHTEQIMANAGWQLCHAVMWVKREQYPTLDWHTRADSPTPSYTHTHTILGGLVHTQVQHLGERNYWKMWLLWHPTQTQTRRDRNREMEREIWSIGLHASLRQWNDEPEQRST